MTTDVWKPVVGHEGTYEVSLSGKVRRTAPGRGTHVGRVLSIRIDRKGYAYVRIAGKICRIHRLIAAAFIGPSDMLIRHLDGNPLNNTLENLAYGTPKENSEDRIAHGRHRLNGRLERTHCRHGHEYTPENTMVKRERSKRPYRLCRECVRAVRRAARQKAREQA